MTPEGKVKKSIKEYLDSLHIYWELRPIEGQSAHKGMPDMWCVVNGIHYEIEVKAPGGKTSPLQDAWKKKFTSFNVICITVDSLEEFKKMVGI